MYREDRGVKRGLERCVEVYRKQRGEEGAY